MARRSNVTDAEFSAMQVVYDTLVALEDDARSRILRYIVARLKIADPVAGGPGADKSTPSGEEEQETAIEKEQAKAPKYNSLAELADDTEPQTNADKALVAGYWLQVCQGAESFDGLSLNRELKNLGLGIANITMALDSLRNQNPSLALQLKKSGTSQQARKTYKLTVAGIKALENMINGRPA